MPRDVPPLKCKNKFYSKPIFARAVRLIEAMMVCRTPGGTVMLKSAAHSVMNLTPGP
jgi:hypothetical protein